ncbi:hypothetical protein ES703_53751 [subsurface metagenome]
MTGEVLKPGYKVLKCGNKPGCIHHFFIDENHVGTCKKCGEERQFPSYWDKTVATRREKAAQLVGVPGRVIA